jgi:4-alpha-glucanotransferase
LFADNPECASPYNPNNRALLNPLYIAINLSPDSFNNPDLTKLLSANTSSKYSDQGVAFIDYKTVTECKYAAFKLLFKHFQQQGSQARQNEFSAFCKQYSDVLALLETTEPTFEYYLQWQAHSQLTQCQQHCIDQGMAIGLINDLAVGCANEGTEFKYQQGLFSQDATLGAPPDPWAPNGQNWGLPAINPQRLADNNYQFYRSLIRANMDAVGGLRIDHVMAIRRLWWCFINNNTQDGCYVYYPFEHLLAILKIESHLNQAIVIGEDLGVVPPEVKEALVDSGIFSNSLFYFEKQQNDEFVNSDDLSDQCLLMIANHDVPPFVGWWQHSDLKIKQQYGLIDTDEYQQLVQQREQEQHRLLRFLNPQNTSLSLNTDAFDVYSALAVCLAKSPSRLFALQLDDLDKQHYPVNIPGTDKEYPNWRRVLTHTCDDIFKDNAALLAAIHSIRNA